jgi:hypothetical protein
MRGPIDDMALDTVLCQHTMDPEPLEPGLLNERPVEVTASSGLHEMKHRPHGARASFALVFLREDATFVGGRYDNWNCPMVRRP